MKKNFSILLLSLCWTLLSGPVAAQMRQYMGIWGQLGEYSLLVNESTLPNSMGAGAGLGMTYELRAGKHFLLNLGLGANTAYTIFDIASQEYVLTDMVDSQGDKFDYVYHMTNRQDAYFNTSVQVPLMIGAHFRRFYFLVGAKFDMSLLTRTYIGMDVATEGVYKQFIDPFTNMPEHYYYGSAEYASKGRVTFRPDVTASTEIGWRVGPVYSGTGADIPKQKTQYRIGLFADYGLMDIHRAQTLPMLQVSSSVEQTGNPVKGVVANDCLSVNYAAKAVNPLMVGVRFSVFFQLPEKKACVICQESRPRPQSTRGLLE